MNEKLYEIFCDASYYDQWAVRPVGEMKWGCCYHLPNKEEAEGLAKELTELRVKLSAAEKKAELHRLYHGDVVRERDGLRQQLDQERKLRLGS